MESVKVERVTDDSAWRGSDMAKTDEWIYELSPADLNEIDHALQLARDIPVTQITKKDFPLPSLSRKMDEVRHALQYGRGFALIRGIPVSEYGDEKASAAYWGLGTYLGDAVPQSANGEFLGHIRNEGKTLADPSARGYQTSEELEYHSDSSDIVGLLCLQTALSGGASTVISATQVHNEILDERPDLLKVLYGTFYKDHRGEELAGEAPYYSVRPFSSVEGFVSANLGRPYILSAQRFADVPRLTSEQTEALDFVYDVVSRDYMPLRMQFEPGDIQFLNNYVTLHSRTAFEDAPELERRRHLLRLWLAVPDLRPIGDELKARRIGIRV